MLSLAVGALQLMLDRGGSSTGSPRPRSGSSSAWRSRLLGVRRPLADANNPFIDPKIFMDRNFATGLVFIFIIGIILLASLALLPPMLSNLGLSDHHHRHRHGAARRRHDDLDDRGRAAGAHGRSRAMLVFAGLLLTAWSLYMMTGFTPRWTTT